MSVPARGLVFGLLSGLLWSVAVGLGRDVLRSSHDTYSVVAAGLLSGALVSSLLTRPLRRTGWPTGMALGTLSLPPGAFLFGFLAVVIQFVARELTGLGYSFLESGFHPLRIGFQQALDSITSRFAPLLLPLAAVNALVLRAALRSRSVSAPARALAFGVVSGLLWSEAPREMWGFRTRGEAVTVVVAGILAGVLVSLALAAPLLRGRRWQAVGYGVLSLPAGAFAFGVLVTLVTEVTGVSYQFTSGAGPLETGLLLALASIGAFFLLPQAVLTTLLLREVLTAGADHPSNLTGSPSAPSEKFAMIWWPLKSRTRRSSSPSVRSFATFSKEWR